MRCFAWHFQVHWILSATEWPRKCNLAAPQEHNGNFNIHFASPLCIFEDGKRRAGRRGLNLDTHPSTLELHPGVDNTFRFGNSCHISNCYLSTWNTLRLQESVFAFDSDRFFMLSGLQGLVDIFQWFFSVTRFDIRHGFTPNSLYISIDDNRNDILMWNNKSSWVWKQSRSTKGLCLLEEQFCIPCDATWTLIEFQIEPQHRCTWSN